MDTNSLLAEAEALLITIASEDRQPTLSETRYLAGMGYADAELRDQLRRAKRVCFLKKVAGTDEQREELFEASQQALEAFEVSDIPSRIAALQAEYSTLKHAKNDTAQRHQQAVDAYNELPIHASDSQREAADNLKKKHQADFSAKAIKRSRLKVVDALLAEKVHGGRIDDDHALFHVLKNEDLLVKRQSQGPKHARYFHYEVDIAGYEEFMQHVRSEKEELEKDLLELNTLLDSVEDQMNRVLRGEQ